MTVEIVTYLRMSGLRIVRLLAPGVKRRQWRCGLLSDYFGHLFNYFKTCTTRNTLCGTWHLSHSMSTTTELFMYIIRVILHTFHCACAKRPYFHFRSKILRPHRVPRPRFPVWDARISAIRLHLTQLCGCY